MECPLAIWGLGFGFGYPFGKGCGLPLATSLLFIQLPFQLGDARFEFSNGFRLFGKDDMLLSVVARVRRLS
jgi:hypothetical protein